MFGKVAPLEVFEALSLSVVVLGKVMIMTTRSHERWMRFLA